MRTYSYLSLFVVLFAFVTGIQAQDNIVKSLERYEPGQGRVKIHQDPTIAKLIGNEWDGSVAGKQATFKTNGYRVQVYAGNNSRESRAEAQRLAARVRESFPEQKVYTTFISPRWICRVGDFRSIEEADALMRQLRKTGRFKEVSIVREQVVISL